jgi:hypothetical protein
MNQKLPKQPRTRSLPQGVQGKRTWKALAVSGNDPAQYAADLAAALNTLSSEGWNITSIQDREKATILLAERIELPVEVQMRAAAETKPDLSVNSTEEFVYSFMFHDMHQQRRFSTMEDALSAVRDDVKSDQILPLTVTEVLVTTHEALDLYKQNQR